MSTFDLARPADSSESEDDDYVPSAEESDGDASDAENKAAGSDSEAEVKKRKKGGKSSRPRKRKGGLFLEDEEGPAPEAPTVAQADSTQDFDELSPEEEKKKADQLWADFLRDVEPVPKRARSPPHFKPSAVLNNLQAVPGTSKAGPATEKKVTITKLMQFAGETIKVEKEVPCDSKEARLLLAKQGGEPSKPPGKPRRGVESLLDELFNKKKKLSTLEKSKLDWENYKKTHGIAEDLQNHNRGKDGYLEKQAFLQRTDMRQFEIEKNLRAKKKPS